MGPGGGQTSEGGSESEGFVLSLCVGEEQEETVRRRGSCRVCAFLIAGIAAVRAFLIKNRGNGKTQRDDVKVSAVRARRHVDRSDVISFRVYQT